MKHYFILALSFLMLSYYAPAQIKIKAVGDIMVGSITPRKLLPQKPSIYKDSTAWMLDSADVTFGNLEGVFINGEIEPQKCSEKSRSAKRCYEFGMPDSLSKILTDINIDLLSMDNNHNSDYGYKGVSHTKHILDSLKINYASKKSPITYYIKDSIKVGVIAFGHSSISYHVADLKNTKEVVTKLDSLVDILIVSFHGGAEGSKAIHIKDTTEYYYGENRGNIIQFAHTAIDAGADIVLGHGPHVLRGFELYKEKFIAYSLGNFLTHGNVNLRDYKGLTCVLDVNLDPNSGSFISGNIIPVKQIGYGIPVYDKSKASIKLIKKLSEEDFPNSPLSIKETGEIKIIKE